MQGSPNTIYEYIKGSKRGDNIYISITPSLKMIKEFIKKRIDFNFGSQKLVFDLNQSLFSSYNIDEGTKILLNSLRKNKEIKYDKILDLGCGVGIVGIFLKNTNTGTDMNFVGQPGLAGGGTAAGWYPVLSGAQTGASTESGYTHYLHNFTAILKKLPGTEPIKAGKVNSTAYVLVKVQ